MSNQSSLQISQLKLDQFINFIKSISLHFQSLLLPNQSDFKGMIIHTLKAIDQFYKFLVEYNRKLLQQIKNAKLVLPFIFYRTIKDDIYDPNFMRYKFRDYQLKYVIMKINIQCHMHVQITKNTNGIRKSSIVFKKFQNTFTYYMEKIIEKYQNQITLDIFKKYALMFLEEIFMICNGQLICKRCRKGFVITEEKLYLPPTIKTEQFNQKDIFNPKQSKYLHQNCMIQRYRYNSLLKDRVVALQKLTNNNKSN